MSKGVSCAVSANCQFLSLSFCYSYSLAKHPLSWFARTHTRTIRELRKQTLFSKQSVSRAWPNGGAAAQCPGFDVQLHILNAPRRWGNVTSAEKACCRGRGDHQSVLFSRKRFRGCSSHARNGCGVRFWRSLLRCVERWRERRSPDVGTL